MAFGSGWSYSTTYTGIVFRRYLLLTFCSGAKIRIIVLARPELLRNVALELRPKRKFYIHSQIWRTGSGIGRHFLHASRKYPFHPHSNKNIDMYNVLVSIQRSTLKSAFRCYLFISSFFKSTFLHYRYFRRTVSGSPGGFSLGTLRDSVALYAKSLALHKASR